MGDIYGRSKMFKPALHIHGRLASLRPFPGVLPDTLQGHTGNRRIPAAGQLRRNSCRYLRAAPWEEPLATPRWRHVGAILGIVLGGVITTFVGWRYIFYVNVPIGIIATYFAFKYITDNKRIHSKIDLSGVAALTLALGRPLIRCNRYRSRRNQRSQLGGLCVWAGLSGIFFLLERRSKNPLINFQMFSRKQGSYVLDSLSSLFMAIGYFAVVFIIIMYLQGIKTESP